VCVCERERERRRERASHASATLFHSPHSALLYYKQQGGSMVDMHMRAEENVRKSFIRAWVADCTVWPIANTIGFRFVSLPLPPHCPHLPCTYKQVSLRCAYEFIRPHTYLTKYAIFLAVVFKIVTRMRANTQIHTTHTHTHMNTHTSPHSRQVASFVTPQFLNAVLLVSYTHVCCLCACVCAWVGECGCGFG